MIPHRLVSPIKLCDACKNAIARDDALILHNTLAKPFMIREPKATLTVVPKGFKVTVGRAKVAQGAHKARNSGTGSAKPTTTIVALADRSVIKGLASRGW